MKYDGMMALAERGRFFNRSRSRNGDGNRKGREITYRFPEIVLPDDVVLVGEICHFVNGVSSFRHILKRMCDNPTEIRLRSRTITCDFVVFDILELDGQDLRDLPFKDRLGHLDRLSASKGLRIAERYPIEKLEAILEIVGNFRGEGVIIKDLSKAYVPKRSENWLKLKLWKKRTFTIERHEITENRGFVLYINNKGYEQKVVCNDIRYQQRVLNGHGFVEVKFLAEEDSGALRQPFCYRVKEAEK